MAGSRTEPMRRKLSETQRGGLERKETDRRRHGHKGIWGNPMRLASVPCAFPQTSSGYLRLLLPSPCSPTLPPSPCH